MIIDLILDRKDGQEYNSRKFYYNVMEYESTLNLNRKISRALDGGNESDVKKSLCEYITENGYNTEICKYVNSVNWVD